MALTVLPLDLARWDETARDCLVLPVFKDDRPLRGAAGLADWRLCGRLSRLVSGHRATSEAGETLLLPPGRRLRFQRVMWFGLGDAKGYTDDRFRADLAWILGVVTRAGVTDWALQLPGPRVGVDRRAPRRRDHPRGSAARRPGDHAPRGSGGSEGHRRAAAQPALAGAQPRLGPAGQAPATKSTSHTPTGASWSSRKPAGSRPQRGWLHDVKLTPDPAGSCHREDNQPPFLPGRGRSVRR